MDKPIATLRSASGVPTGRLAVWWVLASEVVIFGGGIIPDEDLEPLAQAGIERVFLPGSTIADIVAWLQQRTREA